MVLSTKSSDPLVAVIGSTGQQGSSVIRNLIETSQNPYRIRAITRDANGVVAKEFTSKGVEVVQADLYKTEEATRALEGANYVVIITLSDQENEIGFGKAMIDAAQKSSSDLKLIIFSGGPNVTKVSGGKYKQVTLFDAKGVIEDYGFASPAPFCSVQPASFMQNYSGHFAPTKFQDGIYKMIFSISGETIFSLIDINDFGLYVLQAMENPKYGNGSTILACSQQLSIKDMAAQWSKVLGKQCEFVQVSREEIRTRLPHHAELFLQLWDYFEEFGYYGGKEIASFNEQLQGKTTNWEEHVRKTDWSKIV